MAAITDPPRDGLGGDPDAAIRELYSRYAKALHGYVEQFCPDRASAARPMTAAGQSAGQSAGEVGTDSGLEEILERQLVSAALQQLSPAHQTVLVKTFYRLPGRDLGDGGPRARHTARHSQVAAALRARCTAQAVRRARRHRGVLMDNRLPWDITATDADADADADADGGKTAPAAGTEVVRCMIVVMLLSAAALDLTRCGLVMAAARYLAPTAGLVTAGLAATTLTARTARGCRAGHRWAGWAALLIGAASAPQAAASGFRSPYTIPDTATAVLGMLLAITILATAGRTDRRDTTPHIPVCWTGEPRYDPERSRARASSRSTGRHRVRRWVLNVLVDVPGLLSRIVAGQQTIIGLVPASSSAARSPASCSTTSGRHQPTHAEEGAHPRKRRMPPLVRRCQSAALAGARPGRPDCRSNNLLERQPFELARVQLVYGERLRRAQGTTGSRQHIMGCHPSGP